MLTSVLPKTERLHKCTICGRCVFEWSGHAVLRWISSVTVHCFIIGANKVDDILLYVLPGDKLWRQCFHSRSDDERDTWCHDVGAKCHCHLQAHQIWQMAICSVRQLVVCITKCFFLWNKQFCICFCAVCVCVYHIPSSTSLFVAQWRSGREAESTPVQTAVSH